jgi:hypothetical protein
MDLFAALQRLEKLAPLLETLEGRIIGPQPAEVTNTDDPENRRRIKVRLAKNPALETDWLDRQIASPHDDPPVPKVGQTVAVNFYDGDPHRGYYAGTILNPRNNPQATDNPLIDSARVIEGDRAENVGGNDTQIISGDAKRSVGGDEDVSIGNNQTVHTAKKMRLENDAGAFVELHQSGAVRIGGIAGGTLVLGGLTAGLGYPSDMVITAAGTMVIDLAGHNLQVVNAAGASIGGNQIATVGAPDSRGDNLTGRGW